MAASMLDLIWLAGAAALGLLTWGLARVCARLEPGSRP